MAKTRKAEKTQKTQTTQKTRKTQTQTQAKGQPSLNPDAFKPNTVRKGVDGYWWTVIKTEDV